MAYSVQWSILHFSASNGQHPFIAEAFSIAKYRNEGLICVCRK
jgi:hypothetical protein